MSIADLVTAVQSRFGADYLIQVTNYDPTVTSVNTTVLTAAAEDAVGEFQRITGIAYDTTNYSHVSILIRGVILFLEIYKGRDSSILQARSKDFFASCSSLRRSCYVSPSTNSNLTIEREQSGTRPDMDRDRSVFRKSSESQLVDTIDP